MIKRYLAVSGLVALAFAVQGKDYIVHRFQKIQLTDQFWAEGANFGDFNRDGHQDVVAGPYWWEGPEFKTRHEYYPAKTTFKRKQSDGTEEVVPGFEGALGVNNAYADNFFAFTHDFNKDGWDDILIYGFPGKDASWYENPKQKKNEAGTGHWKRHQVFDVVDNESPAWTDLTGDGKPEIVCSSGGYWGYAEPDWSDPAKPWTFHKISPKGPWQRFTHGLGVGDVNGDGRMDILEKEGWWEQPKSLKDDPIWKAHRYPFAVEHGCAHMFAYDVNGDKLNDVITCLAAHGYGLAWYEQLKERDANGEIQFKQHNLIDGKQGKQAPKPNKYGVLFSQPHALDLMDMDGDGLKDIVTGKRFWAHGNKGDDDPNGPAVLYWFKLERDNKARTAEFIPFLIDDNSGIGTQVIAGRINKDKLPDVVVGNKRGVFVFLHEARKVSREEWEKAQPKAVGPVGSVSTK